MSTLREIIEQATPGPWEARFIYRLFNSARRDIRMRLPAPVTTDWPNSELIARLNPQTALLVLTALEATIAKFDATDPSIKSAIPSLDINGLRIALNALNGTPPTA